MAAQQQRYWPQLRAPNMALAMAVPVAAGLGDDRTASDDGPAVMERTAPVEGVCGPPPPHGARRLLDPSGKSNHRGCARAATRDWIKPARCTPARWKESSDEECLLQCLLR
jgi:hypothetical protein